MQLPKVYHMFSDRNSPIQLNPHPSTPEFINLQVCRWIPYDLWSYSVSDESIPEPHSAISLYSVECLPSTLNLLTHFYLDMKHNTLGQCCLHYMVSSGWPCMGGAFVKEITLPWTFHLNIVIEISKTSTIGVGKEISLAYLMLDCNRIY